MHARSMRNACATSFVDIDCVVGAFWRGMIAGPAQGPIRGGHGVGERVRGGEGTTARGSFGMPENVADADEAGASRSGGRRRSRLEGGCSSEEET